MKKFFLMAIITMVSMNMNAQGLQFGVRGGLNLSTESKTEVTRNPKFKTGLHIGGVVNYAFNDRFELEGDLLYSMQGFKDKVYFTDSEQIMANKDYLATSHYLNLPIAAKINIVKGIYIECGPQFGFLLSKNDKVEGLDSPDNFTSENTKKFDFGLLGGLGYKFENGVFIDARYIHGFTDTHKLLNGGKNRNIQVSLGYLF